MTDMNIFKGKDFEEFATLSGGTTKSVEEFIADITKLQLLGLWWSEACKICLTIKDYGFITGTSSWDQFLDECVGKYCVPTGVEPINKQSMF